MASFSNTIAGNNVSNNGLSILISDHSDNNTILENYVSNNDYGILLFSSNNTKVYHNNFIDNTQQVLLSQSFNTAWDDGYPSGGNYWSDHVEVDLYSGEHQDQLGGDGIVDIPYVIDGSNRDNYPLMSPWTPAITAAVDIDPDTLNLRSQRQWITCYIELPESYNLSDIDISTVMLNDTIPVSLLDVPAPEPVPTEIGDYDSDGIPDLMVKFNRTKVIEFLLSKGIMYGNVTLTVTGELFDGTPFEGTDIVKVLFPGDVDDDGDCDRYDFSLLAGVYGTAVESPVYNWHADFNEDQNIDRYDFSILAEYYGKTAV
jgi:parallel beta-helix repeat protein